MEKIFTDKAPKAIGPYSQAIKLGDLVYTSGQIPIDPESGEIEANDIEGQTEQVCKNLGAVLEASGASLSSVIKTTCFLQDMSDFAAFNGVYREYFISSPARSCVAVKSLPKGSLVEIEAVAKIEK